MFTIAEEEMPELRLKVSQAIAILNQGVSKIELEAKTLSIVAYWVVNTIRIDIKEQK